MRKKGGVPVTRPPYMREIIMIPSFGIHQTLDYLNFTTRPKEPMSTFGLFPADVMWTERKHGFNGYSHAWQAVNLPGALLGLNPNRRDMGVHVVLPGKALSTLRDMGVGVEIADNAIKRDGNITRFDVAIDVVTKTDEVHKIRTLADQGEYCANKPPLIHYTPSKGKTVQWDFRNVSVVIYDKAHEQKVDMGELFWNRFEIRVKGKPATEVWKDAAWASYAKKHIDIPLSVGYYQAIGHEKGDYTWSDTKSVNKTLEWLLRDVVTALAKESVKDERVLYTFMSELSAKIDELKDSVYNSVQSDLF